MGSHVTTLGKFSPIFPNNSLFFLEIALLHIYPKKFPNSVLVPSFACVLFSPSSLSQACGKWENLTASYMLLGDVNPSCYSCGASTHCWQSLLVDFALLSGNKVCCSPWWCIVGHQKSSLPSSLPCLKHLAPGYWYCQPPFGAPCTL